MVKLTNKEIIERVPVLVDLRNRKLPVKVSYALAKNINKIEKELKVYEEERMKIINEYCLREQDGSLKLKNDSYDIDPNRVIEFNKEIEELKNIENEIDIHKFDISLLDTFEMTADELIEIDFMIEE